MTSFADRPSTLNEWSDGIAVAAPVPGIDMSRVAVLRADMGSDDVVVTFLRRWADMVDDRIARLAAALRGQDTEGATVVAASLRVTSAMAGAVTVSKLCAGVEKVLAVGQFDAADALIDELQVQGRRAQTGARQLVASYAG